MKMRSILRSTAIGLFANLAGCKHAASGSGLRDIQQPPDGTFRSGIPTNAFVTAVDPEATGRQQSDNWCWAATSPMILNYHGVAVKQADLLQAMCGSLVDRTASPSQVATLLNETQLEANGNAVLVKPQAFSYAPSEAIIDLLTYNQPIVIGLRNPNGTAHAYVMTSVDRAKRAAHPMIRSIKLRDSWPSDVSQRILGDVLAKVGPPDARGDVQWPSTALPSASTDTGVALGGLGADKTYVMPSDALHDDADPGYAEWGQAR